MTGILLLDKPCGPTSHDAVLRARRALQVRRVGHFGTLDPFASGLLVLGVGGATRLAPYTAVHEKAYRATVRLGAGSTTDDPQGLIEEQAVVDIPDRDAVEIACRRWTGVVEQVPPLYSAKHVDGRRAYARARAGEAVALSPVVVRIERIEITTYEWPRLGIEVECGAGTYVRSLARDLGEELGVGGYCESLRRTRSGPYSVESAIAWEALERPGCVQAALRPAGEAVEHLPAVRLAAPDALAVGRGRTVPASDTAAPGEIVRLVGPHGFIGIGETRADGLRAWIQPRRVLFPDGEGGP